MTLVANEFDPNNLEDLLQEIGRLRARIKFLEAAEGETSAVSARVEHLARSTGGWFWAMDADLRFVYFSQTVEQITGIPREWHYGKTREEIGIPDSVSAEEWQAHLDTLGRREPFREFIFLRRGPDGDRWMQTSGVPVYDADGRFDGYCGSATDITERVHTEQIAQRLMRAIDNLSEVFVLWDENDRLVMCNQLFRQFNAAVPEALAPGVRFEDHVRAALAAGLYPDAYGREEAWYEERVANHRNPGPPVEQQRQGGLWFLISEHRLADGSTATVSANITARKTAEREVQRYQRDLERQVAERTAHLEQANQEIQRFTYLVTHDLRAPLVNLQGFASELTKDIEELRTLVTPLAASLGDAGGERLSELLDRDLPEATDFISAASSRMDRQTRALLEYSRLGRRALHLGPIDLGSVVGEISKSLRHQLDSQGGKLTTGALPEVVSDSLAMEQIFGNLLDNAVKYLDPARPGHIEIWGEEIGDDVVIHVKDNGQGLRSKDQGRIFEVFTRAAPNEIPGEGMGLAEVQALVRRLGGEVTCTSEHGEGSTFSVRLPRRAGTPETMT